MSRIKSLHLRNFQAHPSLKIILGKGVTTIIGPSDIGKTAVLRALQWVVFNRPSGLAFLRDGSQTASVTVRLTGGVVRRKRGPGGNLYLVNKKKLVAFGSVVPKEVDDIFRMGLINFQSQHDGPFWFDKSAGEVSRQLNLVVNLGIIDSTLSNLMRTLRQGQAEVRVCQDRLSAVRKERKGLLYVEEMAGEFAFVQKQNQTCEEISARRESLTELISRIKETETLAQRKLPDISPVEALAQKAQRLRKKANSLEIILHEIKEREHRIKTLTQEHARAREVYKRAMGKVCPLCEQPIRRRPK